MHSLRFEALDLAGRDVAHPGEGVVEGQEGERGSQAGGAPKAPKRL